VNVHRGDMKSTVNSIRNAEGTLAWHSLKGRD